MRLSVQKTKRLQGTVQVPGSKSHTVRRLVLATLAKGPSVFTRVPDGSDTAAAMELCRALGAQVRVLDRGPAGLVVEVIGQGLPLETAREIHCGNSGLTARFALPLLGLRTHPDQTVTVDAGEQMRQRPMGPLLEALRQLGLSIEGEHFPLKISGKLQAGELTVDGTTSQYLSALLMALPLTHGSSTLRVDSFNEAPYVDMTLQVMQEHGVNAQVQNKTYTLAGGQNYRAMTVDIPGDYSSAACLIVAGALLPGQLTLTGLRRDDPQADAILLPLLQRMGAQLAWHGDKLVITGGQPLTGQRIDCANCPDLVPALAVLATQASGETQLVNVAHARIKETDRLQSMAEGLRALGADVNEHEDGLSIRRSQLCGAAVRGHGDHRSIMALGVAGLLAEGETHIDTAEGLNKTFPEFPKVLQALGATVALQHDPIVIMGFKHVGKSSVGRALAQALGRDFVDLDEALVQHEGSGRSPREMLRAEGENYLREQEYQTLKKVLSNTVNTIIALGGGTPLHPGSRALLEDVYSIHLTADPDQVFDWITAAGPSPLLGSEAPRARFDQLWTQRQPLYESLANLSVFNHNDYPRLVQDIAQQLPHHDQNHSPDSRPQSE